MSLTPKGQILTIMEFPSSYRSRKFIVTLLTLGLSTLLAYHGKMSSDFAMIAAAAIATYNYAQGKIDERQSKDH